MKLQPVDEYTRARCKIFSEFSVGTSKSEYARRNQNNLEKITLDIYRGKLAEFMVYNYMVGKGNKTTPPDLEIYNSWNKSYDADLVCNGQSLHVKSHFINKYYPVSWLFQKRDSLVSCESTGDFLCLVVMNDNGEAWFYIQKPEKKLFKKPQKESLQKTKVCIYENDLLI